MKKTYRSKVQLSLAVPVLLLLAALEVYLAIENYWLPFIITAVITAFLVYLYTDTSYELTGDQKLRIRIGFLYHKEIYVKSIKRVRPTKNHEASPALSSDRLEISYNRYERVMISPSHKIEFIQQLTKLNPKIITME